MSDTDLDELGPIDYLVVEFPADREPDGSALAIIVDLVDRGIVRVLDLAFVAKDHDGNIAGVELSDMGLTGDIDITMFEGAASGLLGDDDLSEAAAALEPGCSAAVLLYENTWAAPFARALRAAGAQVVANGRIPVQQILMALDELEA